ncbi:Acetyl-CoA carboxylase, alpha subunit [Corchorus olitorius]|uniref:acetyl-CoA carboxytransferase n=1 Tax=Corchorus olitorius TaxID=93759 RepID=A0A1R3K021_9ROSI|nr:Acetyl-CoA carboxylase, alpha subunit [Corchorus olitorius]
MASISLVAGNCGRGRVGEDGRFEFGSNSYFAKDFFASELLIKSFRRGYWSKALKGSRDENGKRFRVVAKAKKGKKHNYPWPDNIDPNLKEGHLTYLSNFKPLEEKPKPVTLAFEKPLVDIEQKIIEVSRMADETGLDFTSQIGALENKYQQALKDLYTNLTPIQRLALARHPNRPTTLDYILNITEKWVELHGDRAGYDDPAIVTGIGSMDGKSYMFIGHQKGRNTKENIFRNFAMPTPHGYRKALRMMKYADHHGFPIITFVDTPGAFADLKSEELGQGEAIAQNLRTMFGLKVPIVTVVIGEGGSGGALAIACPNKLFMLENSVLYVASPEACAAILYKSSQAAPKAAEKLRITAQEHYKRKIADGIIPEPLGGAHADPVWTSQQIKHAITEAMEELTKMDTEELLHHRRLKFRSIGGFQEGKPVKPGRKRNMKPSDANVRKRNMKPSDANVLNAAEFESIVERLKKNILEAKVPSDPIIDQSIKKLKQDVDKEITRAFISMGLQDKLESVKMELSRASDNQSLKRNVKEKVDKLMHEFEQNLSQPGAYLGLKQKLENVSMVIRLVEMKKKSEKLQAEINQKIPDEVKAKWAQLQERLSKGDPLDKELVEEAVKAKKEFMEALKSANVEIVAIPPPELEEKIVNVKKEILEEIERTIDATGLRGKIEELKEELAVGSTSSKVQKLETEIKEVILAALNNNASLKEKVENLRAELSSFQEIATDDEVSLTADEEIIGVIERTIDAAGLREKFEEFKEELAQDSTSPKVQKLETEIKEGILAALNNNASLKEKVENLRAELSSFQEIATDDEVSLTADEEISGEIEMTIDAAGLHEKFEEFKEELARDSTSPKVQKLETEIMEGILAALNNTSEKVENLRAELSSFQEIATDDEVSLTADEEISGEIEGTIDAAGLRGKIRGV